MITSHSVRHTHLWYHVPYRSIENVWGMATKVTIYQHCMCATVYHKTIIDVGCPEILLHGDTFHVRIGGAVIELWHQKQAATGTLNVRTYLWRYKQLFSELTERQQLSKRHRAKV